MVQADMPQIVLFTQTEVLNGSIFISTPEGRLLDQLNNSFQGEPDNRDEFLELTNVTISGIQRAPKRTYRWFISAKRHPDGSNNR